MGIKNYLKNERIHYTVTLRDGTRKSIRLWEHIDGTNKKFKNTIGVSYSWRSEILKKFLDRLIEKYHEDMKNRVISYQSMLAIEGFIIDTKKSHWNNDYQINNEMAMKMLFALKLVSSIDERPRIEESLEIIYSLSDEEISFWSWKVLNLKNKALNGFKSMYL